METEEDLSPFRYPTAEDFSVNNSLTKLRFSRSG